MSMGKRPKERQAELFLATDSLAQAEGHPFYRKLNQLLSEHGFDSFVESNCSPDYEAKRPGRPSIPPGTCFRMLITGYFEGIDGQRGIAWRANDSLSLREFLGVSLTEETPDHSTLTKTRQRLPLEIHERVFQFVLRVALDHKLLVRSNWQLNRRVTAACFRELKTLDEFDWSFNPSIKRQKVYELATGRFIRGQRDCLLLGPPGVGKSYLCQAIGYAAIKAGFVVLYRSIFDLVRDFLHDEAFGGEEKVLAKYLKPDLLIVDDMGMKQLPKRSGEYLFEIILRRYETRSTTMTSNRPLEDWGKLIGDVPSATAILDRFLHHAEILTITGKSYRLRNQAKSSEEPIEAQKSPNGKKDGRSERSKGRSSTTDSDAVQA